MALSRVHTSTTPYWNWHSIVTNLFRHYTLSLSGFLNFIYLCDTYVEAHMHTYCSAAVLAYVSIEYVMSLCQTGHQRSKKRQVDFIKKRHKTCHSKSFAVPDTHYSSL